MDCVASLEFGGGVPTCSDEDIRFMRIAFRQASVNVGLTGRNPSVGCVVVKDGVVVSKSATSVGGGPHAEVLSLGKVPKSSLAGAVLYSTLEPCSHFGKNPPCVAAIVDSGIRRVVIAFRDVEDRVNGRGMRFLQEHDVEVCVISPNLMSDKEARFYDAYFFSRVHGRSFVLIKCSCSLDGKIMFPNVSKLGSHPVYLASDDARRYAHLTRLRVDGILVGGGTYKSDSPRLTCRVSGYSEYDVHASPRRFVLSNSITDAPGFDVLRGDMRDIPQETFSEYGVTTLMIEGGKDVITQALNAKIVNRLVLIYSPQIIGETGLGLAGSLGDEFFGVRMQMLSCKILHQTSELVVEYDVFCSE